MKWFDSAIAWLFPAVLVEGTSWGQLWREKDQASFLLGVRVFFPIVAVVYIAHYFFYDKANNLEPLEFWLAFRLFMAGGAALTLAFYWSPAVRWTWYKAPAVTMCWLISQSQAYVTIWHSVEAWVFCYVLIIGCVLALRLSALKSALFVGFTSMTQAPILIQAGIPNTYIFTGALVSIAVALIARASYLDEVRSFLLNQENMLAQKRIIELNMEFADRIRSFIPKVIAERIDDYMDNHRMSVLEASIKVMTPTVKEVSCLFSDIRGFTKQSRDIRDFVQKSVVPEVKACTDSIESFDGIPRKIGDLIFAYFDGNQIDQNLLNCVAAGMMVSRLNHDMNATVNTKSIKRYVLVSCGEALVGNLGGFDSSIEITALGTPVNLLNRIDELTKVPAVAMQLNSGDLVLSEAASHGVARLAPEVHQTTINLDKIGVSIRDFEEVSCIYTIAPNDINFAAVRRALDESLPSPRDARDSRTIAA